MQGSHTAVPFRQHGLSLMLLGIAVGVVSAIGVFGRGDGTTETVVSVRGKPYEMVTSGVYAFNPQRLVAEGIGWDVVTLLLVVPALQVVAILVARGSLRARLVAIGLLGYLFYQYLMYAMAWAAGPLLPAFVVLYAASLAGMGWLVSTVDVESLPDKLTGGFPRRGLVAFCLGITLLLVGMWVPTIAQVLAGQIEGRLMGQTTLVVQALDLGIVVPLALTTAVLVWRRRPVGHLLAGVVMVKGLAMTVAICAMVVSAWYVEGTLQVGPLAIFAAVSVASAVLVVAVYRSVLDAPDIVPAPARTGGDDGGQIDDQDLIATGPGGPM